MYRINLSGRAKYGKSPFAGLFAYSVSRFDWNSAQREFDKSAGQPIWTAQRPERSEGEVRGRAESISPSAPNPKKAPCAGLFSFTANSPWRGCDSD